MEEENTLDMNLFQAITEYHNKLFPERFAPGIMPSDPYTFIKLKPEDLSDPKILEETVIKGDTAGSLYRKVDRRKYPELSEEKYYHNGIPIDWNNLEESNEKYLKSIRNCNLIDLYKTQ